jgi:hypothetical protein
MLDIRSAIIGAAHKREHTSMANELHGSQLYLALEMALRALEERYKAAFEPLT